MAAQEIQALYQKAILFAAKKHEAENQKMPICNRLLLIGIVPEKLSTKRRLK
jgi:hypothetical protein